MRLGAARRSKKRRLTSMSVIRSAPGCARRTGQRSKSSGSIAGAVVMSVRRKRAGTQLPPPMRSFLHRAASAGSFEMPSILDTYAIGSGRPSVMNESAFKTDRPAVPSQG